MMKDPPAIPHHPMRLGRHDVLIILLTDGADGEVPTGDGSAAATDYLTKPLSLPVVRTLAQPHARSHGRARRARHAKS